VDGWRQTAAESLLLIIATLWMGLFDWGGLCFQFNSLLIIGSG
jgi:hypothetical protein